MKNSVRDVLYVPDKTEGMVWSGNVTAAEQWTPH